MTNCISFLFSLFGFSWVVRRLGIRRTLRLFPVLLLLAVVLSFFAPGLWTLFATISVLKALTFSLNEPGIELLYMPTTDAIKFKAKAWIDVFGTRAMKAVGSAITHASKNDPVLLVKYGSVPTFLISLALLGISVLVGTQFQALLETGTVVGEDLEMHAAPSTTKEGHLVRVAGGSEAGRGNGLEPLDAGGGATRKPALDWSRPPPPPTPPRGGGALGGVRSVSMPIIGGVGSPTSSDSDMFAPADSGGGLALAGNPVSF